MILHLIYITLLLLGLGSPLLRLCCTSVVVTERTSVSNPTILNNIFSIHTNNFIMEAQIPFEQIYQLCFLSVCSKERMMVSHFYCTRTRTFNFHEQVYGVLINIRMAQQIFIVCYCFLSS